MEVLTYFPEMDLKTRPFIKFYNVTIRSPLFTGNASTFINMATAQYRQIGVSPSKAFYYLMLSAGIDRRDLTLEPEQLKEVLDSSGFDFRTRVPHVHEFRAMKFRSPYLINTAKNKGEITGQSLLQRYTERGKGQTIQIMGRILKEAGYPHPNPNPDLRSPDAIRTILDSAKKQVDWAAIRYNELKYLKFDSPIFKGIGVTWLKRTGDTTSRNMRRLLKKVGITNKPSKRWANRIR